MKINFIGPTWSNNNEPETLVVVVMSMFSSLGIAAERPWHDGKIACPHFMPVFSWSLNVIFLRYETEKGTESGQSWSKMYPACQLRMGGGSDLRPCMPALPPVPSLSFLKGWIERNRTFYKLLQNCCRKVYLHSTLANMIT